MKNLIIRLECPKFWGRNSNGCQQVHIREVRGFDPLWVHHVGTMILIQWVSR